MAIRNRGDTGAGRDSRAEARLARESRDELGERCHAIFSRLAAVESRYLNDRIPKVSTVFIYQFMIV